MLRCSSSPWIAALLLAVCCSCDNSGRHAASKLGDTSHPAERGSPTAPLAAACKANGELTPEGEAVILRAPYLQQLTSTSALVGWLTTSPDGAHVEVATPDGGVVLDAPALPEDTESTPPRGQLVWAELDGLEADTTYCYTVVDESGRDLSEPIGFRTAPAADSTRTIRILAFGDSGGGNGDQDALLEQMSDVPFELMIHTGDIAYDNGSLAQFEANFFDVYAPLLRHFALFPIAGNHEYETDGAAPYRSVFELPGDSGERWYSYDWGRIHFAAIDTEASFTEQAAWLDADLAASPLPWKIVFLHKPPYSSGEHGSDLAVRAAFAPIFEKHRVQLVLAGHDHDYERMHPQNGVDYVVTGGGGKSTRPVTSSSFTAFGEEVIHYTYIEVGLDELVLHAIDATGAEFDSLVVKR